MTSFADDFSGVALDAEWSDFFGNAVVSGGSLGFVSGSTMQVKTTTLLFGGGGLVATVTFLADGGTDTSVSVGVQEHGGVDRIYAYYGFGILEASAVGNFDDAGIAPLTGLHVLRLDVDTDTDNVTATVYPDGAPEAPVAVANTTLDAAAITLMTDTGDAFIEAQTFGGVITIDEFAIVDAPTGPGTSQPQMVV